MDFAEAEPILRVLYEQAHGHGPSHGLLPLRLREVFGMSDLELARKVFQLAEAGLVGYDMKTTMPFNDPSTLTGAYLTNVYLTQRGWETISAQAAKRTG
jgi:hypothetical protein